MSGVNAGSKNKKKMAVSADQFEDAEEETEDFQRGADEDDGDDNATEAEPDSDATSPKDPEASVMKQEKPTAGESATAKAEQQEKEGEGDDEDEATMVEEEAQTQASTSPTPTKGTDSPLDALASACVAEEHLKKQQKQQLPEPKPPKEGTKVSAEEISCTDVLCGRGGQSNHHPGNIFFRRLVRAKQEEYLKANKREKTVVAKDIVKLIRMLSPPGRFLKKDGKDESVYVDVGDVQARNKASQALREGAPELREELRDQHSRMNAQNGGGPEVKLPYHGHKGSAASSGADKDEGRKVMSRQEREALAARAAAAQGLMLPPFAAAGAGAGAEGMPGLRRQTDPPDGSDDDEADPTTSSSSHSGGISAAAMHAAAAEERARRLMLAGGAPPGLGAHMLNPHLGFGGLGAAHHMNPFLAGHSPAAAAQLAALQAAGGSHHLLSPQALMMAGGLHQAPTSAAALLQAHRARELAQFEAANYAAATAGANPLFLGGQAAAARAAAAAASGGGGGGQGGPFQESMRLHELMSSAGNATSKREREEIEREIEENYSKAAKLSRYV